MDIKTPKLVARDKQEKNRSATMLELFYDLIFVVAIASVAAQFHHAVSNDHITHGVISYIIIFGAIWWAWSQYTWFASAFDNGSTGFKLVTLWQMIGALIIAVGVEKAFNGAMTIIVVGYVIIRLSAIYLWIKVALDNPKFKITAIRYIIGITICQLGWIGMLFIDKSYVVIALLFLLEFFIPYYAESHTTTHYHPEHIEERFNLLTIIVLGESILASVYAMNKLFEHFSVNLLLVAIGCIFTLFSVWWLYFNYSIEHKLETNNTTFQWGYGHVIIFSATAAIGALVSTNVDVLTHHATVSIEYANLAFSCAVSLLFFGLWFCLERIISNNKSLLFLFIAVLIIALGFLPHSIFSIGILIVVTAIYRQYKPLKN